MVVPEWGYEPPPAVVQGRDAFVEDFKTQGTYTKSGQGAKLLLCGTVEINEVLGKFANIGDTFNVSQIHKVCLTTRYFNVLF